jgi:hypothetical protein
MSVKNTLIAILFLVVCFPGISQKKKNQEPESDRKYWTDLLYRMATPVLSNISKGELVKNMPIEVGPTWDGRRKRVAYMEAFGRLMSGLAPWLTLPDDDTPEGVQRKQLREWALMGYAQAVNPNGPDYFQWEKEGQALVDAAYIANSFLRAPAQLWEPLDSITKQRYIYEFKRLRSVDPPYTNWLLFSATIETFLCTINADYDAYRIHSAIRKIEEWYTGDGWYSDGSSFAFDYYSSYVIHPMYVEVLEALVKKKKIATPDDLNRAKARMQRYGMILERFISPEASFPAFGRSMTYRMAAFQPLALLSWKGWLPADLPQGQVRYALTSVMKRMFANNDNFDANGFLQLGFVGHQPDMSDRYTNTGSLYMTSLVFLPLALPASDPFWTSAPLDWTAKKAWSGEPFPRDHAFPQN